MDRCGHIMKPRTTTHPVRHQGARAPLMGGWPHRGLNNSWTGGGTGGASDATNCVHPLLSQENPNSKRCNLSLSFLLAVLRKWRNGNSQSKNSVSDAIAHSAGLHTQLPQFAVRGHIRSYLWACAWWCQWPWMGCLAKQTWRKVATPQARHNGHQQPVQHGWRQQAQRPPLRIAPQNLFLWRVASQPDPWSSRLCVALAYESWAAQGRVLPIDLSWHPRAAAPPPADSSASSAADPIPMEWDT